MPDNDRTNYADLVARQGRPTEGEGHSDFDLPSPSLFKSQQQKFLGDLEKGKPALELAVRSFSEVYVLWRPWETCGRCKDSLNDPESSEELPEVGDYVCPHTQKMDYKITKDRCLSGDALLASEEFFNLKNGTRCVHICWLEPDPDILKKLETMQKLKAKNRAMYPYDPTQKEDDERPPK